MGKLYLQQNIFADENFTTTVMDIEHCIGEEANNSALKLSEEERREMEKTMT